MATKDWVRKGKGNDFWVRVSGKNLVGLTIGRRKHHASRGLIKTWEVTLVKGIGKTKHIFEGIPSKVKALKLAKSYMAKH